VQIVADNKLLDNFYEAGVTSPFYRCPFSWHHENGEEQVFFF